MIQTKILNKNQFPTKLITKVIKQYLNLKFDLRPFENIIETKKDARFFKLLYIGKYSNIAQKKIHNLVKMFCKVQMLKVYSHYSRSVTGFHIKIHYHFIFNHLSFTNLFVQTVRLPMWVKLQGTSLAKPMHCYRTTKVQHLQTAARTTYM